MRPRILVFLIICLFTAGVCKAQTCTGNLGNPVVHIDFGSGTSVQGPALPAGVTTYSFTYGAPPDGSYTIASSTANMFSSWFVVTSDHTGNAGGYMMVANASYNADTFYIDTIKNLCPGTTYEFAAWVMNLNKVGSATAGYVLPNLTFSVESTSGTALGAPYNSGDIQESSSPTWIQYGMTFKTPANANTVVIKITNNAKGGNGNDILLDDITFRPCGPMITAGLGAKISSSYINCTANVQQDTLTANVSTGYTVPAYQWQILNGGTWTNIAGANTQQYIFTQPASVGTYQYRLASAESININTSSCQVYSNTVTLTVTQTPTVTASSNGPTVCEGTTLNLFATGGTTYSWTDPNGTVFSTLQNPSISNLTLLQGGKYTVTGLANGCSATASVTITVQPKITAKVNNDTTICAGATVQLKASGGTSYLWSPAKGLSSTTIANPVASPTDTTTYTVIATNNTCSSTASVTIGVIKAPVISAGGNRKIVAGQSIKLNATAKGNNLTYAWTPTTYLSDATLLTPIATPPKDITYTLHVTSPCVTVTDSAHITVYAKVTIPNAFSPNGDSVNDTWNVIGLDAYPTGTTYIYNRTGQLVFSSIGYGVQWDGRYNGKPLPEGTYYYVIDLKIGMGLLSGYVAIIR